MITNQESAFDSSMIEKCFYDYSANKLKVRFKSGALYEYNDVSHETWASLCGADSQGKFFNENIKHKYDYSQLLTD
mgnify:CR=1 FL=1